jgi:UDP:flavonoid glycosyltransferase YjiC (YdhE family)
LENIMKPKIAFISLMPDAGHILPLLRLAVSFAEQQYAVQCFFPQECVSLAAEFNIPMKSFGKVTSSVHKEILFKLSKRSIFYNAFSCFKDFNLNYNQPIISAVTTKVNFIKKLVEQYNPALIVADDHWLQCFFIYLAGYLKKTIVFHGSGGNYRYKKPYAGINQNIKFYIRGKCYRFKYNRFVVNYGYTGQPLWIQWIITGVGKIMNTLCYLSMIHPSKKIDNRFIVSLNKAFPLIKTGQTTPIFISTGLPYIERELTKDFFFRPCSGELFPPVKDKRNLEINPSLKRWIDETAGKPIVYVGLGTMIQGNQRFIREIIRGLAELDIYILWVAPPGQIELIRKISSLPNLRLEEYVPQPQILALKNVRCFITHCGAGGIQDSLFHGKPMLCIPFMFDQPFNSSIVELLQAGIKLWKHRVTAKLVRDSVWKLLYDPEYWNAAQNIMKQLQSMDGGIEVVRFVENFIEMEKSGWRNGNPNDRG